MELWSQIFLGVVWMPYFCIIFGMLYYSGGILFIKNWKYLRLLKKCLNVFVMEGVEEEVCIIKSNDWKKFLFCMKVYQL